MSQDGNNNLFGNPNFQTSPFDPSNLYHPDITSMQFAASVPHRPSTTQQHVPMNFPPFPNQDVMPPHPHFSLGFPGSPYERPDSLGSNTSSSKQLQTKAERRAEHNATERARRESLNVKFQQLAFTLPNLQNDSRPSKGTIIDRTLDFVKGAIIKEERMQYRITELEKFSRYLLSELDKKNNIKDPQQQQQGEEQTSVHSPLMNHPIANSISSPPAPGSVASEDSMVEEVKSDFSGHQPCLSTTTATTKQQQQKKENGITNRRPVSRTSVPMIPKLDYTTPTTAASNTPTTNWPITTTAPSMKPQSNYHQLLEQQQQQLLLDQQLLMKEQPSMPMTNNVFQHSFNPTTTPTTNMRFQNTKFSEPEQDIYMNPLTADPSANFLFNNNSNNSFHHNLMELHHRR